MKLKRTNLVSRLAQASLLAVMLLLTVFSIGMALLNQQTVSQTETQTSLTNLYSQSIYMLLQEDLSLHDYTDSPSASIRHDFQAAAETFRALFGRLQQSGDADDRAMVSVVSAEQDRFVSSAEQLFAAVDAHDLTRASKIHHSDLDPLLDHMQAELRLQANHDQADENRILAQLAQTQRMTLLMTPVVFAIGLLLIGVSWWILQVYRKHNEASQAEIVRLEHVVSIDPLTGLGNYYAYQESLTHLSRDSQRAGKSLVLALLDIDEFKIINDEQGHQRGNEILLAIAASLRETTPSGCLFRLNADDFAALLPRTSLMEATLVLEHLPEEAGQRYPGVTVSIGIAQLVSDDPSIELFQAQAASALQEARRRGRNRVVTFDAIVSDTSFIPPAKEAVCAPLAERRGDDDCFSTYLEPRNQYGTGIRGPGPAICRLWLYWTTGVVRHRRADGASA